MVLNTGSISLFSLKETPTMANPTMTARWNAWATRSKTPSWPYRASKTVVTNHVVHRSRKYSMKDANVATSVTGCTVVKTFRLATNQRS